MTNLFFCFSQRSDCIFDVGANLGWFAFIAGVICEGRVHAFEMDVDNVQRLRTNVEQNAFSNVKIRNAAVSNQSDQVSYWKESEEASPSHSVFTSQSKDETRVTVNAITLKKY